MRPDTDYNNRVDVSIPTGSGGTRTIEVSNDGYLWRDLGSYNSVECANDDRYTIHYPNTPFRPYAPITTTADSTMSGSLRDLHRQFEKLRMEYEDVRRWSTSPWVSSWNTQRPMQGVPIDADESLQYLKKIFDIPDDIDAKGLADGLCELFDEL